MPIDTQISILEKEIKELTNKLSKTKVEEKVLESRKQELDRLLAEKNKSNTTDNKPSNRTDLYWGIGIVGILSLVLGLFILSRIRKKKY